MNETFSSHLELLPHGQEFRFITELESLDPGVAATASYLLRGDEAFLRGHFPGQPLMPGVLLIEGCAQLAGIAAQSNTQIAPLNNLKLTAIRAFKIFTTARPGDTVRFQVEITGRLANLIQARVKAFVKNALAAEGEVTLSGSA